MHLNDMKNTFLLFCLITLIQGINAETNPGTNYLNKNNFNNKKTIAIWPFQGDNRMGALESLHNIVTDAVSKAERFYVVERAKLNALLQELDIQKGYETMNSDVLVEQGKALGANYHIFGHINSVSTKRENSKNTLTGKNYISHTCVISLNLRIVNVETGAIEKTETLTVGKTLDFVSARSEGEAWNKSCEKMGRKVTGFIKKAFPLTITLLSIEKEKKGKATEVLVGAGEIAGLKKNDKLKVFELQEVNYNGVLKERRIPIADLTVKEVQGSDFSVCRVKKGGGKLKNKILGRAKLICETK